jgi:multidrug efflux pump
MISISEPFIRRPVGTTLLAIGLFLVGIVAYGFLPVSSVPNVDFPMIRVSASRPGADPSVMAATVAAPLERKLGTISGVDQITSTSSLGSTSIQVQFAIGRDIDRAARDVQAAINASLADLPSDLPSLPKFRKSNPAAAPVFVLALTSKTISTSAMYDVADTVLAQRISQVPGVGEVTVSGADQPAVRIALNPVSLANAGIATDDVRTAIINANPLGPVGIFNGDRQSETLSINKQMRTAAEFRDIVIKSSNGNFVRLSDVAEVEDSVRNSRSIAWFNKQPAVLIQITKQGDANVIDTVDGVRKLLPELKKWIPAGVEISTLVDRTGTIRASVEDMQFTLLATAVLVMVVVFVFLRRIVPTIAAGVSVPLALAGTCAGMWLAGFSIDNLSLMALAISVGFVVDDAIVMIENMYRNLEQGMAPYPAAVEGAKQIGFTVLSISLSLIAAFTPLIFMDGIVGRLLREFSLTLVFAIAVSTVVSLTITPMICAHYIKETTSDHATWYDRAIEGTLSRVVAFYAATLRIVLGYPVLTLIVFFATVTLTVVLYVKTPKGYFPTDDSGLRDRRDRGIADISFQAMLTLAAAVADIVMADPAVAGIGSIGRRHARSNRGFMFISLKPSSERGIGLSTTQVIDRLRRNLSVRCRHPPVHVRGAGYPRRRPPERLRLPVHAVKDRSRSAAEMGADRGQAHGDGGGHHRYFRRPRSWCGLQLNLVIDRKTASSLGVRVQDIDNALNNAFSQRQISIVYTQRNQYMVVLEIDPKFQSDPRTWSMIYVAGQRCPGAAVGVVHYERSLLSRFR